MKEKKPFIQLSEKTVHIGALVNLNEEKIIENGRGEHLDLYRSINPKIVQYIQIQYFEWAKHLNVQCLVGNYWFENTELKIITNLKKKKKKTSRLDKILRILTVGILISLMCIGMYYNRNTFGLW